MAVHFYDFLYLLECGALEIVFARVKCIDYLSGHDSEDESILCNREEINFVFSSCGLL